MAQIEKLASAFLRYISKKDTGKDISENAFKETNSDFDSNNASNDNTWFLLNKECSNHAENWNFASYRNTRFRMSEIAAKEGRYEVAIYLLCEVVYYDLCGYGNTDFNENLFRKGRQYAKDLLSITYMNGIGFIMAPRVKLNLLKYKKKLNWSDDKFEEFVSSAFMDFTFPFHPFTKDECVKILFYELGGNEAASNKLINKAEKRVRKEFGSYKF